MNLRVLLTKAVGESVMMGVVPSAVIAEWVMAPVPGPYMCVCACRGGGWSG